MGTEWVRGGSPWGERRAAGRERTAAAVQTAAEKILEVEVSRHPGQALVVAKGEIDYSAARTLREALRNALALEEDSILVDLTGVRYMDSSGVYALLDAWREGGGRHDFLRLRVGTSPAARVIHLAGVDQLMAVESDQVGNA